ncbi:hypothetical protein [Ideonella paludis]
MKLVSETSKKMLLLHFTFRRAAAAAWAGSLTVVLPLLGADF